MMRFDISLIIERREGCGGERSRETGSLNFRLYLKEKKIRKAIVDSPEWTLQYGHLFLKSLDDRVASKGSTGGEMAIYLLKNIPDDLWKECRKMAIDRDISMRTLLIQLLREWIGKENESNES